MTNRGKGTYEALLWKGGEVGMNQKVEFIESYIKIGNGDYQWNDNHGELVRCKECKECYFASNRVPTEQSYVCGKHGMDVSLEWFCADGERD